MRIAWFAHRYAPSIGGAETYSRAMVRRFVAAGHTAHVFTSNADDLKYFSDARCRSSSAPAFSEIDGALVHRFPARHFPAQRYVGRLLSYLPHWPTRCRFESFMPYLPGIERIRDHYDAVFAVGFPFTIFPFAAYRLARACKAPLVLTPFLHLSTPGDPIHRLYTRPHSMRLLQEADLVVSPTQFEADYLAAQGIPLDRNLVLPMAIDKKDVTAGDGARFRHRLGLSPAHHLVGQLGALDHDKGTCDLVCAIAALNAARPRSRPIHLALAGRSTPDFNHFLDTLPDSHRNWLHLLGPLPQSRVANFYDAIDVFAMPSRTDSFGIVFLEAWANKKPVIAAAAGGVVEVVKNDENGLLVPFGDRPALVASIARLLADPTLAARLGHAGARHVAESGSWDHRFEILSRRLEFTRTCSPGTHPQAIPATHLDLSNQKPVSPFSRTSVTD